jgi:hypothetical protein
VIFWHDDQFRYEGQRGTWDDGRELDEPTRGYIEQVQRHIDEPILYPPDIDARAGELTCRG